MFTPPSKKPPQVVPGKKTGIKNRRILIPVIIVLLIVSLSYRHWHNRTRSFDGFKNVAGRTSGDGVWAPRIEKVYFSTSLSSDDIRKLATTKGLHVNSVETGDAGDCRIVNHSYMSGDDFFQLEYVANQYKKACLFRYDLADIPGKAIKDSTALVEMDKSLYLKLR